jgi:alpha-galactosidase
MTAQSEVVLLSAGGVSLAVELAHPLPRILYWGADLGDLAARDLDALRLSAVGVVAHNSPGLPRHMSVLPTEADVWSGTPGIEGFVVGGTACLRLALAGFEVSDDRSALELVLADDLLGLQVRVTYRLDRFGILAVQATVTRAGDDRPASDFVLCGLTLLLPVPERALETLDFTGKWSRERGPQRRRLAFGTHLRESRRGRPSLDSPYLMIAGTESFGFRHGEIWATHVGWSGNQRYVAEQLPEGAGVHRAVIGGGELILPGEIVLGAGEEYQAPTVYFAWSSEGLDGVASAFHAMLRGRPGHPSQPRPLVMNTWEAVYFDHDLPTLLSLIDAAAAVGVERVVLDDGWFEGRRDDSTGLGDWFVDKDVWPDGLWPVVNRVRSHGMQFGLWFEPEMVNLGSRIIGEHPDWLLAPTRGAGPAVRNQHVLNIAHPAAWEFIFGRIDALVGEYTIDYIKWDHNRELHEAARRDVNDRPGVNAQTLALYRMLDALRSRHPSLEIESCASGGGRVDLGILQRTDRVWVSDCNDPVERQMIQRWTAQLIPPELTGAHVASAPSHTTKRTTPLSFRLITALFAHAGIEQDMTRMSAAELEAFTAWAALYKRVRDLIHSGRTVRADLPDDASLFHGVVASDRSRALFAWVRLATSSTVQSGRVRFPGLDCASEYRITVREEAGFPSLHEQAPAWMETARSGSLIVSGRLLTMVGMPMPTLDPEQAMLLELDACPGQNLDASDQLIR